MSAVKERFLSYVKYHTASDDTKKTYPSTERQLFFANVLAKECREIGLSCVNLDANGYVTALLPANTKTPLPTVGFLSHMDTSNEASGENVRPILWENYDGSPIPLTGIMLSPEEFPALSQYIGDTIITADGATLLGADDKAGIAEIMTAMEYLLSHPEIPHGNVRIGFTPDEEIGRGVDFFDVAAFDADFAYTMDGGRIGELEFENFNAARANVKIKGKSVHPGTAKGVMKNAALIAADFASHFNPKETPQETEGYEGFFHLTSISGTVSEAHLSYILRDFEKDALEKRKSFLRQLAAELSKTCQVEIDVEIYDEYENMAEIINEKKEIIALAKTSMEECGITPLIQPIRGGTDGARLSYMGLPCPNLFTGGHNFHGPYEFIPVSSMEKAVSLIITIIKNIVRK